jgi:hypothetical protein
LGDKIDDKMSWACMGEMRNFFNIEVVKRKIEEPFGRPVHI